MFSNRSRLNKLSNLSYKEKIVYLSKAKRVTIGIVTQMIKNNQGQNILKDFYVAKIRGVIVGNNNDFKHPTRESAKEYGKKILEKWKRDYEDFYEYGDGDLCD